MEWGIPTLIETSGPEESAALCKELGFFFVELNMNLPEYQQLDVTLLKSVSDRYGIYFTVHLDENTDICNYNPRVANAYMRTVLDAISFARKLDIPLLNMHLSNGVYFTLPDKKLYLYDINREYFLRNIREAIRQCEKTAQGEVTICIENTGNFALPFIKEALDLFLQSPLFALTFDIGHDHSADGADKPYIIQHQDKLRHFHIHDALGKRNHMSLGTGELNLTQYIALAKKKNCRSVLEVKTERALKESVGWLREHQLL